MDVSDSTRNISFTFGQKKQVATLSCAGIQPDFLALPCFFSSQVSRIRYFHKRNKYTYKSNEGCELMGNERESANYVHKEDRKERRTEYLPDTIPGS